MLLPGARHARELLSVERVDVGDVVNHSRARSAARRVHPPDPSISIAPRDAKCRTRSKTCAGHDAFVQRDIASPGGWSTALPQTGQASGMTKNALFSGPLRAIGPTTRGITSPARVTRTYRRCECRYSRCIGVVQRRALDRHAADLHRIEHGIGIERAGASDRNAMSSSFVRASRGLNLYAIAQRGSRATTPSRSCSARSSTFHNDAVDLVVELVARCFPRRQNAMTPSMSFARSMFVDRKPSASRSRALPLRRDGPCATAVGEEREPALPRSAPDRVAARRPTRHCAGWQTRQTFALARCD